MDSVRRRKRDPELVRRDNLAVLARKLNLRFAPNADFKLADRFSFLAWLNRGDVRYAANIFHGDYAGHQAMAFDYCFSMGKATCYWSAYILEMKANFPDTIISHENMQTRFLESMGESHITFESADFSRAFNVRSSDKKFAFDVCNPSMMNYLLANRDLILEINRGTLLVLFEDWLRPEKVEANFSRMMEVRNLLPQYLFENPSTQ